MYACYAIAAPGLEQLTAAEIGGIGGTVGAIEPGGVGFDAAPGILYAANLRVRTASRLVVRAASFHAASFADLERHGRAIPWTRWVGAGGAVHFRVTSHRSRLYHEDAVAERLERAAQAAIPDATMVRAPADAAGLDDDPLAVPGVQRFLVRIVHDTLTLSVDSSGALLHRRGYRRATAKAPLRETLAAALLLALRWDGSLPLVDPLCGSGTIPVEGALMARRVPPGWQRRFAFERWPEFRPPVWEYVRGEAAGGIRERAPAPIVAADRDAGAVEACRANAERAGVAGDLAIRQAALTATLASPDVGALPPGLVLTNPPYGVRVGEGPRLRDLYAALGNAMQGPLAPWTLGLLTADRGLATAAGAPPRAVLDTATGGLRVGLYRREGRSAH